MGALFGGEMRPEPVDGPDEAGTCTTLTMTAGAGREDCTGADCSGMDGTARVGPAPAFAATNPAALAAESAPVTTTTPETPPIVQDPTRRSARSRSSG